MIMKDDIKSNGERRYEDDSQDDDDVQLSMPFYSLFSFNVVMNPLYT